MNKTIVLGPGRCGSNLIIETLKGHPDINVVGEILHKVAGLNIQKEYANNFLGYNIAERHILTDEELSIMSCPEYLELIFKHVDMVKILYHQLKDYKELQNYIVNTSSINLIHLKRNNALARKTSEIVARKANTWMLTPKLLFRWECPHVALEAKEIWKMHRMLDKQSKHFYEIFSNKNTINLCYETFILDIPNNFTKLQQDLNLNYTHLKIATRKSVNQPLSTIIDNFAELKKEFKGTELEWCFE